MMAERRETSLSAAGAERQEALPAARPQWPQSPFALPMPAPCFHRAQQLPASYANFLIINGAVLVPAFRQPRKDAEAADVLAACFPGREVISVDCLELVWGLGALHCVSQQQPAPGRPGRNQL